jgi:DNA polymerase V
LDLVQKGEIVSDLFMENPDPKRIQLMHTFDAINAHYGKNSVFFAAMGVSQGWRMRSEKKSGDCTTNWSGLATVKC